VTLRSTVFDSYLVMHTPSGANSPEDDDSGGGSDSRIPATGTYTLPETGIYTIEASSFNSLETGAYTINLTGPTTGSISGKVVSPSGTGLRNTTVVLTDSLGVKRTATTSSFGLYNFDNVLPGTTYTLSVASRLYRFAPQQIQFNDDLTNVNFTGLE
ncbi:MAG TPA: carboxypeptidase-like regulatory domain-containing protein, partial [Pyrinomonadaceae bacterium]|nr:carboxypeptidase-like regulatory domain-containing protein [Pyrinomonadaceae bacterium]